MLILLILPINRSIKLNQKSISYCDRYCCSQILLIKGRVKHIFSQLKIKRKSKVFSTVSKTLLMSPENTRHKIDKSELDRIIARELEQLQGCLSPATLGRVACYAKHIDASYWPLLNSQLIVPKSSNGRRADHESK